MIVSPALAPAVIRTPNSLGGAPSDIAAVAAGMMILQRYARGGLPHERFSEARRETS